MAFQKVQRDILYRFFQCEGQDDFIYFKIFSERCRFESFMNIGAPPGEASFTRLCFGICFYVLETLCEDKREPSDRVSISRLI